MRGFAFALAIFVAATAPASASDKQPGLLLAEINTVRELHGLKPLRAEARLAAAAHDHAADMVARDFFDHRGPGGPGLAERVARAGYAYGRVAENIAAGQEHVRDVVKTWMLSEGHRRNLLNAELVDAGVGYTHAPDDAGRVRYRRYWVAIFGRRAR